MRAFRLLTIGLVLASVFTLSTPAQAQNPLRFSEQLVVTPARSESTLDRVPAFVTILTSGDVARSAAQDIPDLLRQAGVHVVDVTGNRRSYRVDLRGFGATAGLNTLLLVDGRRVNQPDLGGIDWAQIPLARVERVEIIRGSGGAVLFGDNAAGGVINIITKAGGTKATDVSLVTGAFASMMPALTTRGSLGPVSYAASAGYGRSDGHRQNAETRGGDLGGQLGVRVNQRFDLTISGGYHTDKTGLPGALRTSELALGVNRDESTHPDDFADIDDGYAMATPRVTFGGGHALVDVSLRQRDSRFFSSFPGGSFTADTGIRTVALSPKVVVRRTLGPTNHHLVAGLDVTMSEEDIEFSGMPDVFNLKRTSRGTYVHDELSVGRATLSGGYRYEAADYTFAPSDPAEQDYSEHAVSGGATVAVNQQASVFGRVSRAFRTPVLDEMFDFFGRTISSTLVPQQSVDIEGGVRFESGPMRASISVFRSRTDDEIFFNPVGGFGFGANENLDGTSVRTGVDLAASTVVRGIEVGGAYVLTDTTVEDGFYDGQSVPGVPRHRGAIYGRMPLPGQLSLGLDVRVVGERFFEGDFTGVFGDQDAYAVVDAKVTYRRGRARVFLDVKNLFDEEYSEYGVLASFPDERAFYPSPGIHAFVGVEFGF